MKIIIIALFISYAFAAAVPNIAITAAANSADACKVDVTVAQATGKTAADTNTVYAVLATCTTAPTDGTIANLKTAGCSFIGLKGVANTTSFTISATASIANSSVAADHAQSGTYTALTGCTAAAALATGSTVCSGAATMVEGTKYYWSSDSLLDDGTTDLATLTAVTNSCTDSSDSSLISMSFAALASVF